MITHRNAYINTYNFIAHLRIQQSDAELWTLPMFHANGWGGVYAITAMGGKHVVLRAPEADDIYRLIQDERCTFACMAPAVLARILEFERKDQFEITTRPRFTVAGAPPPQAFIERPRKRTRLGVHSDLRVDRDLADSDRGATEAAARTGLGRLLPQQGPRRARCHRRRCQGRR